MSWLHWSTTATAGRHISPKLDSRRVVAPRSFIKDSRSGISPQQSKLASRILCQMSRHGKLLSEDGGSLEASKEWSNVEDNEERRKIQNRVSQRKYRARLKERQGQSKQQDLEHFMALQSTANHWGQQNTTSYYNDERGLDQDASLALPWGMPSTRQKTAMDFNMTEHRPSFYQFDSISTSRKHDPRSTFAPTPTSDKISWPSFYDSPSPLLETQQRPSMNLAYINSLPTPPPNDVWNSTNLNNRKSIPAQASTDASGAISSWLDYHDFSHEQRCEIQQQLDRDWNTNPIASTEREVAVNGKIARRNQHKNPKTGHKAVSSSKRPHKDDRTKSKRSKQSGYDPRPAPTKVRSKTHKVMMRRAYRQGRKEVVTCFEKQKSRLQSKAEQSMDRVIETYEIGVCLEVFRRDPDFAEHLQATKARLLSLSRSRAEAFGPAFVTDMDVGWKDKEEGLSGGGGSDGSSDDGGDDSDDDDDDNDNGEDDDEAVSSPEHSRSRL